MRRFSVVVATVLAVAACKSKPTHQPPPPNVPMAGSAAMSAGSGAGSGSDMLVLPRADGTPPKKTTKPLAKADFEKLAKLEYPGFTAAVRTLGDKVFEVRQMTNDHPRLWATITIQPCFDCVTMTLDKWKPREEELKRVSLESLRDVPGVDWELGVARLAGAPIIYTYQLGAGTGSGGPGGPSYGMTDTYIAYYNDGVNQIRVIGSYKDDPTSKEQLAKMAPKEDLEALTLAFLDVYTHAWAP